MTQLASVSGTACIQDLFVKEPSWAQWMQMRTRGPRKTYILCDDHMDTLID